MKPNMSSEEIEAVAAAWFAKREGGAWNAADEAQLQVWLDSSTAHRVAYIRIVTAWERSGRLSALGAGVPSGTIPPPGAWNFPPASNANASGESKERFGSAPGRNGRSARSWLSGSRWTRALRAVAAVLVLGTVADTVWHFSMDRARSYRTPIGALATIPLSDGSKVMLNTDSQIDVALDKTERRITLDRGEAFFDVSKDAARPFVVEVADKRVVAVGTEFSVRRDSDEIRVLVTEGRVRIKRLGDGPEAPETQLPAGSEARTAQTALLIDQPTPAKVEQLLSWRTGYIVFRDTSLADAVAEFNRYSARKTVIQDPAIAGIRIGGQFRSDDIGAFLSLLQSGFPINVQQHGDRIVLTKR
jgi:transmembrane sensor